MTETEQLELPLAVQPSDFKQTEFPWRILCEQKALPRKRTIVSAPQRARAPRQPPSRIIKDSEGFDFLGLTFTAVEPPETAPVLVADTPSQTVEEDPPFRLEM